MLGGEKPPDGKLSIFDTKLVSNNDTELGIETDNEKKWRGTDEVPQNPSWAQIIGGQVADDEVRRFEESFRLMVPGDKVDINKLNSWMENFGEVTSIKPKIRKCPLENKFREDTKIPQEERDDLVRWCQNRASRGPDVEVIMDLKVSVPMILPINNWNIEVQHEDQVPQCQNCYLIGHYTSRCVNKKTQLKTYSSFANAKWGSVEDMNDQRKIDTIQHKLTVTRLLNRGVKPENIKLNRSIDNSTSKAIITRVREDIEQRYKSRTKFHAKSDVFDRIKEKLSDLKDTDGVNLTEKGRMLKTLLVNRRMKIGEMKSLRLPVNLNELANKYEKKSYVHNGQRHNDLQR